MLIDQLPEITTANDADEIPIEQGTTTRKIKFVNLLKNVLKLTGGIITGNLTIQKISPGVVLKITNLEDGVAPATTTNQLGVRFRDKNDANVAIFADHWNQNGQQGLWMSGYREGVANGLYLVVDSNGNRVVRFSEAAPWRSALGLAATAFTPTRNTTNTGAGNAYGFYDPGANTVRIYGFARKAESATGIPTASQLFSIPSAYRPSSSRSGAAMFVLTNGNSVASHIVVNANGDITQSYTSTSNVIVFMIEYSL